MTVYCVMRTNFETDELVKVFVDKEKAKKYVLFQNRNSDDGFSYVEMEVSE